MGSYRYFIYGLVLGLLSLGVAVLFRKVWTARTSARRASVRATMAAFSSLYTLLFAECLFAHFAAASDQVNLTLASKLWFQRYWHPVNSIGCRDVEHDWKALPQRKVLFVVGDSFVAGHGIRDCRDRFGDVLGTKLAPNWEVVILALNGWNTEREFYGIIGAIAFINEQIARHGKGPGDFVPDAILLSYFINDIEGAGAGPNRYLDLSGLAKTSNPFVRPFVDRSFMVNFLYWRLYRAELGVDYEAFLRKAFDDPDTWSAHRSDIENIVRFAQEENIGLGAVIWPSLAAIPQTHPFVRKVAEVFADAQVPYLDLTAGLEGRPAADIVVNAMDTHPNERVHREVADLIHEELCPAFMEP